MTSEYQYIYIFFQTCVEQYKQNVAQSTNIFFFFLVSAQAYFQSQQSFDLKLRVNQHSYKTLHMQQQQQQAGLCSAWGRAS